MSVGMLAYPFLFLTLFFESFILVTLLSRPAREARARKPGEQVPSVAVIVPCWNEEATIADTCESLLALEYPSDKLEIILVNDGSTDTTAVQMERFAAHKNVRVIHKENGGKHTALNAGLAVTNAEFIGCLDADSFVAPDALRAIVPCFERERVGAVTAAMSIYQPKNILQHMQNAEYIFGIAVRHTLASINGIYVTPGPFSFYRHSILKEVGDFRHGYQTEDLEMALRLQKAGYEIENSPHARVYTKSPDTLSKLIKQRTRWTSGFLRNILGEYRGLLGARMHGVLGIFILPTALLAIVSSIFLFSLTLFELVRNALVAFQVSAGIPLSYSLAPHASFDWFYFPTNGYFILAGVTLISAVALTLIGKRISKTPGGIGFGLVSYALIYGLVTPLWFIRATADVTIGKHRKWRS